MIRRASEQIREVGDRLLVRKKTLRLSVVKAKRLIMEVRVGGDL